MTLKFEYLLWLQFGCPGEMKCPSSLLMSFVKCSIQSPNFSWQHHKLQRRKIQYINSVSTWVPANRKVEGTHLARGSACMNAQHQRKGEIPAAEVISCQRGYSGTICHMKCMIWKPKSQLQKRNSSEGFFCWDLEVLLRETEEHKNNVCLANFRLAGKSWRLHTDRKVQVCTDTKIELSVAFCILYPNCSAHNQSVEKQYIYAISNIYILLLVLASTEVIEAQ